MPTAQLDPDRFLIAWECFASPAGTAVRGQRFKASHPIVRSAPGNFVEDGIPEEEWPTSLDRAFAMEKERVQAIEDERQARFEAAAKQNKVKLSVQLFRLKRDIVARAGGLPATIERGSVVLQGNPLLAEFPDDFEPA